MIFATVCRQQVYEQKDPLVIYKIESISMPLRKMDDKVNKDIVSFLSHAGFTGRRETTAVLSKKGVKKRTDMRKK